MVLRLAWRNIWRQRRRTLITIASIAIGLALAVFFVAIADGVYEQLIDQAIRMQAGHLTLEDPGYRDAPTTDLWVANVAALRREIESLPAVEETKLLVLGQGVARSATGGAGVAIMGVKPGVESRTSPLARNLVTGSYLQESDGAVVVVGSDLARQLHVTVGRKLVLTANDAAGQLREELCRVKGIFETGSEEVDGYVIQTPISFTRRLFGIPEDAATQVAVILRDPRDQEWVLEAIRRRVVGQQVAVLPWQEVMPELAAYIRLDKGSNYVMQVVLLLLIMFTIFNTILMSVLERKREFAVLLALGTEPTQIMRQVLAETLYLGLIGCTAGLLIGGLASYAVQVWGLDLRSLASEGMTISGFAVSLVIRAKVTARLLLWSGGLVLGATILLGLIPMRQAVRVSVADTLRG